MRWRCNQENADNKLYGHLSFLAPEKKLRPELQIAIGGCLAQKDKSVILEKAPYVDVVFGTHNMGSLPALLERARVEKRSVSFMKALSNFDPLGGPAREGFMNVQAIHIPYPKAKTSIQW